MAENCSHDCDHCGETCSERQGGIRREQLLPGCIVKRVIGVVSGKGGVGKSMVTGLLAGSLQKSGRQAAILDADITGPSIPKMFGLHGKAMADEDGIFPVTTSGGVQVMSTNLILEHESDPVLWRGPLIGGMVAQFWNAVHWQNVDCMFVDMPPGTGDVALTVFQSLPIDGIVIVTSPQELVEMIVGKAVHMAERMNVSVLALVENMSYTVCPHCGQAIELFGPSRLDETAAAFGIPTKIRLPLLPELAGACDGGKVEDLHIDAIDELLKEIVPVTEA